MPMGSEKVMKVLLAPDKFKGSLTAAEVAAHLADGLLARGISVDELPLADGGDGSVAAAIAAGFAAVPVTVATATGHPHTTQIALGTTDQDTPTAVVEVANTCGLHTLPGGHLAPLAATSTGVGQAVRVAVEHGARRIVLALGGSASTDGGAGLLAALGVVFRDGTGHDIQIAGGTLPRIATVDRTGLLDLTGIDLVIASDVANPLTGPHGAAAVYGPQKGATPDQVAALDAGLQHLVQALTVLRSDAAALAREPGAGAAGGLGFAGLLLGGQIVSGADYFLDLLDFDHRVADCDMVITGEGRIDDQTRHGKLPAVVAHRSRPRPVIAVVGHSDLSAAAADEMCLTAVYALTDHTSDNPAGDPQLSRHLLTQIARTMPLAPPKPVSSSV
jgi:glycerate kinase